MSRQILTRDQSFSIWESCLRKIYDTPASVTVIAGEWKTGKTDFALRLSFDELKEKLGIIKEIGTNIEVYKDSSFSELDDRIRYVDNFVDLESFLFGNRNRKVFIYDEAIKTTPSRKAMSKINTKWLEYVPELSKARCHLIIITQEEEFTEKLFLHPTFVRARWIKLNKTTVELVIGRYEKYRFYDIPKTSLIFDPFNSAIWRMQPKELKLAVSDEIKIAFDYADGLSTDQIVQKYDFIKTRKQAVLWIQKGIRKLRQILQSVNVSNERREG